MTAIAPLAPQIIEIAGPDATAFAQAQFSSNVAGLANGYWQWSAWLSAQGRVRAFFHLLRFSEDRLWLVMRGGDARQLRDALARYVLRAKLALSVVSGMRAVHADDQTPKDAHSPPHHRIDASGGRVGIQLPAKVESPRWLSLAPAADQTRPEASNDAAAADNRHALADIDAGLVWLDPVLEDKLLPTWIGLDALGATSTNKGCYPGQEIVARLHFKGGNKRWLHRIGFTTERLPSPGEVVGEDGIIVCSARGRTGNAVALAVLDEHAADALRGNTTPEIAPGAIERVHTQE